MKKPDGPQSKNRGPPPKADRICARIFLVDVDLLVIGYCFGGDMVVRRLFFSDSSQKQLPIANSKSRVPNDYRLVNSTSGFRGVELEITMLKATSINSKSVSRLSYVRRRCTTLDNRGWRQSRNPRTGLRPYAPLSDADLSPRFLRRNGTSYALFS